MIKLFLILLPFIFILSSIYAIPNFRANNQIDKETISLLQNLTINDKFIIGAEPYPTSPIAFYSYAAVYYNLSTPSGWVAQGAGSHYLGMLDDIARDVKTGNCGRLIRNLEFMNTTKLITYGEHCQEMQDCSMKTIIKTKNACLLNIKNY